MAAWPSIAPAGAAEAEIGPTALGLMQLLQKATRKRAGGSALAASADLLPSAWLYASCSRSPVLHDPSQTVS